MNVKEQLLLLLHPLLKMVQCIQLSTSSLDQRAIIFILTKEKGCKFSDLRKEAQTTFSRKHQIKLLISIYVINIELTSNQAFVDKAILPFCCKLFLISLQRKTFFHLHIHNFEMEICFYLFKFFKHFQFYSISHEFHKRNWMDNQFRDWKRKSRFK